MWIERLFIGAVASLFILVFASLPARSNEPAAIEVGDMARVSWVCADRAATGDVFEIMQSSARVRAGEVLDWTAQFFDGVRCSMAPYTVKVGAVISTANDYEGDPMSFVQLVHARTGKLADFYTIIWHKQIMETNDGV